MNKLKFLIISFFLICISTETHACLCGGMEEEVRQEKINSAEFIGIFKVLESKAAEFESDGGPALDVTTEHGTAYRIRPLVTYKGSLSSQIVYVSHNNGCNPSEMKIGGIYTRVVIKNKYGVLVLPSSCLYVTGEEWADFEKKAEVTDEWKAFEAACKDQGKQIRSVSEPRCSKKTTDQGKSCKDRSECEGFCAVPYAEYELTTEDFMARIEGKSIKRPAVGKCSEWTDSSDGMVVEHGYIEN